VLRDGVDIAASQFYAYLPRARTPPYTEPASPTDVSYAYQAAFHAGATAVVSIHVSRHLSQVFQHAIAARDYLAPAPIEVIDSGQTGIGMWPAVIRAAQLANLGASVHEVHEGVVAVLARTHAYVMVETLDALRRSGRIRRIQELVGTLVDAHPILTADHGEAALMATVRPRRRAVLYLRDLVGRLAREHGAIETLLVCGTSIEAIAEMEALLAEQYRGTIQKTWLGPANGANLGPAVAVAVVL
jgi:DegV family protein with EDD domain